MLQSGNVFFEKKYQDKCNISVSEHTIGVNNQTNYCMAKRKLTVPLMERAELETKLKTKNQIEVSDSAKLYIVQITDKHMRGEAMPIDYARPLIEKIVLSDRQVEFLREERERMYKEAMDEQKIKFF